jgi:hypothetical protein
MYPNKKTELVRELLLPSALGAVLYAFGAGLVIGLHQLSSIQQYLQVSSDINFSHVFLNRLDGAVNTLLGQTRTDALVVGLFWAGVGLVTYVLLRGIAHFIADVEEGIDARRYLWPRGVDHNRALLEAFERVLFRILAFAGFIVVLFGPLARLLGGPLHGESNPLNYVVWFVLLWLSLHLCVVLVRLTVLKLRLFG